MHRLDPYIARIVRIRIVRIRIVRIRASRA